MIYQPDNRELRSVAEASPALPVFQRKGGAKSRYGPVECLMVPAPSWRALRNACRLGLTAAEKYALHLFFKRTSPRTFTIRNLPESRMGGRRRSPWRG